MSCRGAGGKGGYCKEEAGHPPEPFGEQGGKKGGWGLGNQVGGAIQLFFISIGGIFTFINNYFIDTNLNITLFQFLSSTLGMGLITNVLGLPNAYFFDTKHLRDLNNKYKDCSIEQEINAKKEQMEILKSEIATLETSIDYLEVEEKRKELSTSTEAGEFHVQGKPGLYREKSWIIQQKPKQQANKHPLVII